jgi:signal transduction histidine kinase
MRLDLKKLRSPRNARQFRFLLPHKPVYKEAIKETIDEPVKEPMPFASALAHEVRNPLATINLAVQILKSPIRVYDHTFYLDIILKASGQINDLISDLLKSWQTDDTRAGNYSIHQLLDEALAMTQDQISLKNVMVRRDYSTIDCEILVNKQKLKIALANIIINAIDAMPPEKGKLKLITKSINGKCVIEIEDNGIGISKENLANIFTPYFTDKVGGIGLGLSTTMDILKSDHVTVDVESEEGKGTRFILSFNRL